MKEMKMFVTILTLTFLFLVGARTQDEDKQVCVSCEGLESKLQSQHKEIESLQKQLNYWQNTTIDILEIYPIHEPRACVSDEKEGKLSLEDLSQQIQDIINQTQGVDSRLLSIEHKIENIKQELFQVNHSPLGTFLNPASSCKALPQGSPSRHYWIQNAGTGYANREYCDMTRRCCNSTGGWMRVAHLNVTDTNQQCPSGFRLITSPKRTCGTPGSRCVSTTFPLNGVKYSRVCGKIIGYQYYTIDAFDPYYLDRSRTIDSQYVDGVSLTHGQRPRKHIWTFAAAHDETRSNPWVCPCTKTDTPFTGVVPPFIGQDFFCETGSTYRVRNQFYHADPLWDGLGCGPTSSCCGFNSPPWFCKQLPQPTTDDIEMRACTNEGISNEYLALETVEIYVQ